jgi:hypothetical protein
LIDSASWKKVFVSIPWKFVQTTGLLKRFKCLAIWICRYYHISSNKIRTSPQLGPRIAWIGNPHQQNCMVEVGTWSLYTKVHPEKNRNRKKLDGV